MSSRDLTQVVNRLILLALLVAGPACVHRSGSRPSSDRGAQVGLASFYGERFEGRRTASGAIFRAKEMTCAHRTLPFGTKVRVTHLETGRSVVVTVTDRGPFVHGRIIDVSLGAARKLGFVDKGVAKVRVERIRE